MYSLGTSYVCIFEFFQISEFFLCPDSNEFVRVWTSILRPSSKSEFSTYVLLSVFKTHCHGLINLYCVFHIFVLNTSSMIDVGLLPGKQSISIYLLNQIVNIELVEIANSDLIKHLPYGWLILFVVISGLFGFLCFQSGLKLVSSKLRRLVLWAVVVFKRKFLWIHL